eukprot:scaffold9291_cov67-Isochrysis_galbana.AAC.1
MEEVAKAAAAMEGVAKEAMAAMQGVAKMMTAKAAAAMTTCQPPSPHDTPSDTRIAAPSCRASRRL